MITKSDFVNGNQCLRSFWLSKNNLKPPDTIEKQFRYSQGRDFEELVHQLYPDAQNLIKITNKDLLVKKTQDLIKIPQTLIEPAFVVDDLYIRSDILEPVESNWYLYEIKGSSKVKNRYITDLAFQKYVLELTGLNISKCFILHANNKYVKEGPIDLAKFIIKKDITDDVNKIEDIEENLSKLRSLLEKDQLPEINYSKNCTTLKKCINPEVCWAFLPEYNIFHLPNKNKYRDWVQNGIYRIEDLSNIKNISKKDQNIVDAILNQKAYIDKQAVKSFLNELIYPLSYLDFETVSSTIPLYDFSRPWQQIPFQFSLHIQYEDDKLEHYEYLAQSDEDPRKGFLDSLQTTLPKEGNIIVFNKIFEKGILNDLKSKAPKEKNWVSQANNRMIDLQDIFKKYLFYHPKQKGSSSLKAVLPVFAEKNYSDLIIKNGEEASAKFYYTFIKKENPNIEETRKNLLEYCSLDTQAMILIMNSFKKMLSNK